VTAAVVRSEEMGLGRKVRRRGNTLGLFKLNSVSIKRHCSKKEVSY
jgi:hypothetical protein